MISSSFVGTESIAGAFAFCGSSSSVEWSSESGRLWDLEWDLRSSVVGRSLGLPRSRSRSRSRSLSLSRFLVIGSRLSERSRSLSRRRLSRCFSESASASDPDGFPEVQILADFSSLLARFGMDLGAV